MYHIKVRVNDTTEWTTPSFPRCSTALEYAREDATLLAHVYDHVAIFEGDMFIEEIVKED